MSRTVLAGVSCLFCRWPMQKSVSVELDQMQSKVMGILAKVPRLPHEHSEDRFKKRQNLVNIVCERHLRVLLYLKEKQVLKP